MAETGASPVEQLYESKVTWIERLIISNFPYDYHLLWADSPSYIFLKIKDLETETHEAKLEKTLKEFTPNAQFIFPPLYEGMPVMLPLDNGSMARGEISISDITENTVKVFLVDNGDSLQVSKDSVLPVTLDLLRIPKIGLLCHLLQTMPSPKEKWSEGACNPNLFSGEFQAVIFNDYVSELKMYEINLEVDGVNVSMKMFETGLAKPAPLDHLEDDKSTPYHLLDYADWVGLKVKVYSLRAFKDSKDKSVKVVLQMDVKLVEEIQNEIDDYVAKAKANRQKATDLSLKPGSACLAKYGGGKYFRAKVIQQVDDSYVQVEYVDYKDNVVISSTWLMGIPETLVQKPEAAVVCQVTDLLLHGLNPKQFETLQDLASDKDLYAVVDAFDSKIAGKELLVSLHQPTDPATGASKPITDFLGIKDKPRMQIDVLQPFVPASQEMGEIFLKKGFPNTELLVPGVFSLISCINSSMSVWWQFENDIKAIEQISYELKMFYGYKGCDDKAKKQFHSNVVVGDFVATTFEKVGVGIVWYRGRVKEVDVEGKGVFVHFMDYGNNEWVALKDAFPLHVYFFNESTKAFEASFLK